MCVYIFRGRLKNDWTYINICYCKIGIRIFDYSNNNKENILKEFLKNCNFCVYDMILLLIVLSCSVAMFIISECDNSCYCTYVSYIYLHKFL